MHQFGVKKIITSLDSSIPSVHDNFRGYNGAFRKTMDSIQLIRETDIEVSINMTIGNHNKDHIPEIVSFIRETNLQFVLDVITPEGRGNDLMEDPIAASKILKNIYDSYPEIIGYKKRIIVHIQIFVRDCITSSKPSGCFLIKLSAHFKQISVLSGSSLQINPGI